MRAGIGLMWDALFGGGRRRVSVKGEFARGTKKAFDFMGLASLRGDGWRSRCRELSRYKTERETGRFKSLEPSSSDLHPSSGGRFVFERQADATTRYDIGVYLPSGVEIRGVMSLSEENDSVLEVDTDDPWVLEQLRKLSRVLRRTRQQRIVRWRPRE